MNKFIFNKFAMLLSLLSISGVSSSKEYKASKIGEGKSLSRYTEDNFNNLPLKRVGGKWRVRR